jgi:hypothetical protein
MAGWGPALVAEMNARLAAAQAEPPKPLTNSVKLAMLCELADAYGWERDTPDAEPAGPTAPDEAQPGEGFTHAQRTASHIASF